MTAGAHARTAVAHPQPHAHAHPRYRRSGGRAPLAIALLACLAALAAGCNATLVTTSPLDTGTPVDTGAPGDTNAPVSQVTIDPSLLAILPRQVDSIPVIESPEGDSDALADDVLPTLATSAVAAVAVDQQAQDFVYVLVVKLKPGAMTDNIFRDWRDSYDSGACSGDSQVVGNASATVGGNTVYIGTCANGMRTYHLWLKDKGILISDSSIGDKKFGLVLLGTLRK